MANVLGPTVDGDGNITYDISVEKTDSMTLGTANSYMDKNIILNFSSNGIDTTDATATSDDIVSDKTAYVNDKKVTGSLIIQNYYTGSADPASTLGTDGDLYFKTSSAS